MQFNIVFFAILPQLFHLHAGKFVLYGFVLIHSGYIVVRSCDSPFGMKHTDSSFFQIQESHGTGHFVYKMLVNEEYIGAIGY